MASGLVMTSLTQNPIEVSDLSKFIIEQIFTKPELLAIHGIQTGIKMQEQIIFASQMGLTGQAASGCTRITSGATSTLTQKYWTPVLIEDTLINCPQELDALFKAYFTKVKDYKQRFDIEGTDLEVFFSILFLEACEAALWRAAWFGDTEAAAAASGTAGLASSDNVKFFSMLDGLWKQIFTAVAAETLNRYTISALVAVDGTVKTYTIFEGMWAKADQRLKNMPNKQILVTNTIFENYRAWLQSMSIAFETEYTEEGLNKLRWNGMDVVDMGGVWDTNISYFLADGDDTDTYYLPNRALLTVKENIPIGTDNEDDFTSLEMWYEKKERNNYMAYGFTLDAKLLEEYLAVVAY